MSPIGEKFISYTNFCTFSWADSPTQSKCIWSVFCLIAFGDFIYFMWLRYKEKKRVIFVTVWPGSCQSTTYSYQNSWEQYPFRIVSCRNPYADLLKTTETLHWFGSPRQNDNLKVEFVLLFVPRLWKIWGLYKNISCFSKEGFE